LPLTLAPCLLGFSGLPYGMTAAVLGLIFLAQAVAVVRDEQDEQGNSRTKDAPAKALFKYSILYLFMLFGALAIDRLAG
jgi:heme o synthase